LAKAIVRKKTTMPPIGAFQEFRWAEAAPQKPGTRRSSHHFTQAYILCTPEPIC